MFKNNSQKQKKYIKFSAGHGGDTIISVPIKDYIRIQKDFYNEHKLMPDVAIIINKYRNEQQRIFLKKLGL